MSLDDKCYPDGGPLTSIDNRLIRTAGHIGRFYQQLTGRPYQELAGFTYHAAAFFGIAGAYLAAIEGDAPSSAASLLIGFAGYADHHYFGFVTPKEEELQCEARGWNRCWPKAIRLGVLSYCALQLALVHPTRELINQPVVSTLASASMYTAGILLACGNYLSRASLPPPPKKSVVKEKLEELTAALASPQPVTIPVKSTPRRR